MPALTGDHSYGLCTLLEGDYVKGAAALVNSAIKFGFRGSIYVGYRGSSPKWPTDWMVSHGIMIHMIEMTTDAHLTNVKPNFMLAILDRDQSLTNLVYCDPDIVLNRSWSQIAEWLDSGVALCEDINSPVCATHPRRRGWRMHLADAFGPLRCRLEQYVNGGFVGVDRSHRKFLERWQAVSDEMAKVIGGLQVAKVENGSKFQSQGFWNCFSASDQDALNATLETEDFPVSLLGRDAMGFIHGELIVPHAVGPRKPWRGGFIVSALRGFPPRAVDKLYLNYAQGLVKAVSQRELLMMSFSIRAASLISRFWRRI